MTDQITIPGYEIIKQIGSGGMAKVYLAIQTSFGREVALKVMSPLLSDDSEFSERFLREARIVSQMQHNNIVSVFDVGHHDQFHYMSMEYLPGKDLKARITQNAGPSLAIEVSIYIASALNYAHSKGFLHRDIKPENIMFREDGAPVLTDFGIARAVDAGTQMTKAGMMIGTPSYMSPEQAKGESLDGRCDLYSLGVVFFETLTGYVPYRADSSISLALKHLNEPIPILPEPFVVYQELINKMMAKNADERFADGEALIAALGSLEITSSLSNTTQIQHALRQRSLTPQATPIPTSQMQTQIQANSISNVGATQLMTSDSDQTIVLPTTGNQETIKQPNKNFAFSFAATLLIAIGVAGYFYNNSDTLNIPEQAVKVAAKKDNQTAVWLTKAKEFEQANQWELAREAYITVITVDPDNREAQLQLGKLIQQYQSKAQTFYNNGNIVEAQNHLLNILRIEPNNNAATDLQKQISISLAKRKQQKKTNLQIQQLLDKAKQAETNQHLMPPYEGSAFSYYQQSLELDNNNIKAVSGLNTIGKSLLDKSDQYIQQHKFDLATEQIHLAIKVMPDDSEAGKKLKKLVATKEAIENKRRSDARKKQEKEQTANMITGLLKKAIIDLENSRITNPTGNNAVEKYHAVLRLNPNNSQAKTGLNKIAEPLLAKAIQSINNKDVATAKHLIKEVRKISPQHNRLAKIKKQLEHMQQLLATAEHEKRTRLAKSDSYIDKGHLDVQGEHVSYSKLQSSLSYYTRAKQTAPDNNKLDGLQQAIIYSSERLARAALDDKEYKHTLDVTAMLREHHFSSSRLIELEQKAKALDARASEKKAVISIF